MSFGLLRRSSIVAFHAGALAAPLCAAFASSLSAASVAQGATWFVDDDALAPGSGTALDPFRSIQRALDWPHVHSGDRIVVLPGTYRETLSWTRKALELVGRDGAEVTILDAEGRGRALEIADVHSGEALVRGLTVTGGDGRATITCTPGLWCTAIGGGVLVQVAAARFVDCTITGNHADMGGGIGLLPRSVGDATFVRIEGCRFELNSASDSGGAVATFRAPVSIVDSRFEFNRARSNGGALYSEVAGFIEDYGSYFAHNACAQYLSYGGAVILTSHHGSIFHDNFASNDGGAASYATLVDCTLTANRSGRGGAASDSDLVRCTLKENSAECGGGAYFGTLVDCHVERNRGWLGGGTYASTVTGSVLLRNEALRGGGAAYGRLIRCTVTRNSATQEGGGVLALSGGTTTRIDSCIVAQNHPEDVAPGHVPVELDWSLVGTLSGSSGSGTIVGDPDLWHPETDDLRLTRDSAAIDLGNPALPLDPDGTRADAGAFPFDPAACAAPAAFCAASPGSGLTLALTRAVGAGGGLSLATSGAQPGGFVVVAAGLAPGASQGTCLGMPSTPLALLAADSLGAAAGQLDEATLIALGHPLGALRYVQAWGRDGSVSGGLATSAAYEWRVCR